MADWIAGDAKKQTQKRKRPCSDRPLNPTLAKSRANSSSGSGTIVSFGAVGMKKSRNSYLYSCDQEEMLDDVFDEYFNQTETKSRLSIDQIQFLERSFEADNKLEPERKSSLDRLQCGFRTVEHVARQSSWKQVLHLKENVIAGCNEKETHVFAMLKNFLEFCSKDNKNPMSQQLVLRTRTIARPEVM